MDEAVQQAAERLRQAGTLRRPCPPVHRLLLDSQEAAYAVQHLVTELQTIGGAGVWGRKLLMPSSSGELEYGTVMDTMLRTDGCTVTGRELVEPSIVACLVVSLVSGLTGSEDDAQIQRAVGAVRVALELLDRRIAAVDATSVDLIADNLSAGLLVLGDGVDRQGGAWSGRVLLDGIGCAAATVITWPDTSLAVRRLAAVALEHDRPLAAGEFAVVGSFGPAAPLIEDGHYAAEVDGRVAARLSFVGSAASPTEEDAS